MAEEAQQDQIEEIARDVYCSDGSSGEDIVISGISGRFAGCDSVDEVLQTIFNEDAKPICAFRTDRFKREYFEHVPIATIKNPGKMDAEVARLSNFSAKSMDPQMRIAHEVAYEVLVDAGYNPESLSGSNVAVYAAIDRTDFMDILYQEDLGKNVGIERCVRCHYANYISFSFNFTGPSYVLGIEESSVLCILARAMQDMELGHSEFAIVISHHLEFNAEYSRVLTQAGYLPVDETGTPLAYNDKGFAYGECVGAVLVQKAKNARRIYASIMGISEVTEGLLVRGAKLSTGSLKKLYEDAYKNSSIKPEDISYLECDWVVPQISLKNETDVIAEVFCNSRKDPLWVGSAKWNFGHCGAASGICALLNVILCMEHGMIPPTRDHDARLSKCPALEDGKLKIVSKPMPFNGSCVGVTSFAMSGVAFHTCLKMNKLERVKNVPSKISIPRLILFSSRVKEGVENFFNYVNENAISDELFSLLLKVMDKGEFHRHRGYGILGNKEGFTVLEKEDFKRPVWFLMNSIQQFWKGMALDLMKLTPFSESVTQSAEILKSQGIDISTYLKSPSSTTLHNDAKTLAIQWVLQIALVDLLKAIGIVPDHIIGFGLGDSICGYAAETNDKTSCLTAISLLIKALESAKPPSGLMATVEISSDAIKKRSPANVYIACELDENLTVVSGPVDGVKRFVEELKKEGVPCKEIWSAGYPLHTPLLSSAVPCLESSAKEKEFNKDYLSEKWFSSVKCPMEKASIVSHLALNLVSPGNFYDNLLRIPENAIIIEIGPHCTFEKLVQHIVGSECEYFSLMSDKEDAVQLSLTAFGRLYALGLNLDVEHLYPPAVFPVPRSTPMLSNFVQWNHQDDLYVCHHQKSAVEFGINDKNPATFYLADYCKRGQTVMPPAGYLVFAWQMFADQSEKSVSEWPVVFENVRFVETTALDLIDNNALQLFMLDKLGNFSVYQNGTLVVSGELREYKPPKTLNPFEETEEPVKPDEAAEAKEDSSEKKQEDSSEKKQEDSSEKKQEDSSENKQEDSSENKQEDSSENKQEDSSENKQEDSSENKQEDSSENKQEDSSEKKQEDSSEKKQEEEKSSEAPETPDANAAEKVKKETEPPIPPYERRDISFVISRNRIYEILNSKGYECGVHFQNIMEADIDGSQGLVKWKGNWITFLESILMFPCLFNKSKGHTNISKIRYLKLNPAALKTYLDENDVPKDKDVPLFFDEPLSKYYTAGIELVGSQYRQKPLYPVKDKLEYRACSFDPFDALYSLNNEELDKYKEYFLACQQELDLLNKYLQGDTKSEDETKSEDPKITVTNICSRNQVLLKVLQRACAEAKDKKAIKSDLKIYQQYLNNIHDDASCKTILEDKILSSILNVIEQNIMPNKIQVLEVTKAICPLSSHIWTTASNSNSHWDFTVIHPSPDDVGFDFKKQNVTVQTEISPNMRANVILGTFLHGAKEKLKEYLSILSTYISGQQFIFLLFRSDITAAEKALRGLCNVEVDTSSIQELEEVLEQQKLRTVCRRSDDLGLHIYLLKKSPATIKRVTHMLNENSKQWVVDVKRVFHEVTSQNSQLWIVVENMPTSGVVGIIKYLQQQPGGEKIRCIFICDGQCPSFKAKDPIYAEIFEKDLVFNIFQNGAWGCLSYMPFPPSSDQCENADCILSIGQVGDLSSMRWVISPTAFLKKDDPCFQNICQVYYAGLSYYDVMIAKGAVSDTYTEQLGNKFLGHEFSGRNRDGKRVFGLAPKAMSSSVIPIKSLLWDVPDSWTLEEACTVPLAYSLAYYALYELNSLGEEVEEEEEKSVFVHCGSGALGQAIINIAMSKNCNVFTTVGSEEKREYLKRKFPELKPGHISSSRNASFRNDVLHETNGKGVDYVINTLPKDNMNDSYVLVAFHGSIVDFRGNNPNGRRFVGMKQLLKNISIFKVSLNHLLNCDDPDKTIFSKTVHKLVQDGIDSGVVKPLDATVFNYNDAVNAFRHVDAANHLGKFLLKMRDEEPIKECIPKPLKFSLVNSVCLHPEKIYYVFGYEDGITLSVADWLIQMGAKRVLLLQKTNFNPALYALYSNRWKSVGAMNGSLCIDFTDHGNLKKQFSDMEKLAPVGGVFYVAQSTGNANKDLDAAVMSEGNALRNLDTVTRDLFPQLELFVCISCVNPDETNILLEYQSSLAGRICDLRMSSGLHGLSVQWENNKTAPYLTEDSNVHSISMLLSALTQCVLLRKPIVASKIEFANPQKPELDICYDVFEELYCMLGKVQDRQRTRDLYDQMPAEAELLREEELVLKMNERSAGIPIFFILPPEIADQFEKFYAIATMPVYAIVLSSEMLTMDLESLAKDLLKELFKDLPTSNINLAGYGFGALVAYEIALQCENSLGGVMRVQSLTLINALNRFKQVLKSSPLIKSISTPFAEIDELMGFLGPWFDTFLPRIEKSLARRDNFDHCLSYIADQVFDINGREQDREEVLTCLQSEIRKRRMIKKYVPVNKLQLDLTLIESQKFVGEEPTKEKLGLDEVCNGDVKVFPLEGENTDLLKEDFCKKINEITEKTVKSV